MAPVRSSKLDAYLEQSVTVPPEWNTSGVTKTGTLKWIGPHLNDSDGYYYLDDPGGKPVHLVQGTVDRLDMLADVIARRRQEINKENVMGGRRRKSRRVKKRHASRRAKKHTRRSGS